MEKEVILAPSILAADFSKLGEQITQVEEAGAEYLHIDVMDGLFVPSISFGFPIIESIRKMSRLIFDCHLMINEPSRYISEFAAKGADIITVHYEACEDLLATIEMIKQNHVRCGISINPESDVECIRPYLNRVDMVLVMSVHPGFGGQKFIEETYEKLRKLKHMRDEMGLMFDIEVDGGINSKNLCSVVEAGANVIVSGSSIFAGDIAKNIAEFKGEL